MKEINLIPDDFADEIEIAQCGGNSEANTHADALAGALAAIADNDDVADDSALKQVGRACHEAGGLRLMQLAWYRLQAQRPLPPCVTPLKIKLVQYAWHDIGEWRS